MAATATADGMAGGAPSDGDRICNCIPFHKRYTKNMDTERPPRGRSDLTTDRLRAEILAPGDPLAEATVARRLGVSRVPVREALFTLEREGLVGFTPTGRAFVRTLTPQDFEELFVMRLTLEPIATRLAAPHLRAHPEALIENLESTGRATSILDVTRLDLEFHQHIMEQSGNARLLKAWKALRWELGLWLGRLHRLHQKRTRSVRAETLRAHHQLITIIRTQSPAACEAIMRKHILGWRTWLPESAGSSVDVQRLVAR